LESTLFPPSTFTTEPQQITRSFPATRYGLFLILKHALNRTLKKIAMKKKMKAVKGKVVLITLCCLIVSFGTKAQIKLHLLEETQQACIGPRMAGTEDNKFGCEGGIVIKDQGIYYCFTTEVWGSPKLLNTRLAQWNSSDGVHFTRIGTIIKPESDTTSGVYYREPWTPYPIYNEREQRWNLFFTG
jgi:hypothetical protein